MTFTHGITNASPHTEVLADKTTWQKRNALAMITIQNAMPKLHQSSQGRKKYQGCYFTLRQQNMFDVFKVEKTQPSSKRGAENYQG